MYKVDIESMPKVGRKVDARGLAVVGLGVVAGILVAAWLVAWSTKSQTFGILSWSVQSSPALSTARPEGAVPRVRTGLIATAENKGQVLFGRYCDSCHPGAKAQSGPSLLGPSFRTRHTVESIAALVRNGGFAMPAYKPELASDAEVIEIARYVLGLGDDGRAGVNPVPVAAGITIPVAAAKPAAQASGAAPSGQALYDRSCNACHPAGGAGMGPSIRSAASKAKFKTANDMVQFLRKGGGAMPAFGPDRINDTEINELAKYIAAMPAE